ncbi:MAG: tripartite tricarboxylate transporter permease [Burkholderiales bacterium]|nr:tripartite tricarboxylate transporter permease [Burkholderiales bacterium]
MEILSNLIMGFGVAVSLQNVLYCLLGCVLGTLIGVLPGIGPLVTISMLLPITFNLPPIPALIMLAGIYYGSQYGGSTTAILVNLPGETSSVVTCLDGYQMARQGRAGPALAIAAIGSFVAGCFGVLLIALFGPIIAEWAFEFGAAEYFALMFFALVCASVLAHGELVKALGMVVLGLLIGLVGTDVNSGLARFSFGLPQLTDGIGFTVIAVGMFAVSEIVMNVEKKEAREVFTSKVGSLMPSLQDLRQSAAPILRGTLLGAFFGTLPGTGPSISAFSAYMLEKKIAKDPSKFGKGAIQGVASPEAANNAATQTSFIPTLTLGIPGSATMALMLGALTIQGIAPGPQVMTSKPDLFWGLIASMWIGNLMLLVLNLPMVGVWVKLLKVPYRWLFPSIIMFCCVGNYSLNNSPMDLYVCAVVGFLGYILVKLECEPAPLMLGFVLGPLMEENLRRALLISRGDPTVFFTRPISLTFMVLACVVLIMMVTPAMRRKRTQVYQEAG